MKNKRVIIFLAALIFMVAGILVLSKDLISPYVHFTDQKLKAGNYVQIIGKLDKAKPEQPKTGYSFILTNDDGDTLTVNKNAAKPVNFEHAEKVVVLGRYNSQTAVFEAGEVLTKCPSKYEKKLKEQ
ncbi:MAG: cytochrome c maturation protein CcmE [Spirochaetia bacterium]|jgi:cytochrome c-type biogenesis protein CcmE|nr:cytochrome c maturation protein CcmE [Spirochaetia bacterium]